MQHFFFILSHVVGYYVKLVQQSVQLITSPMQILYNFAQQTIDFT